jgi:ADP-L-glycero-D-manno-heptose 6-epimerase
MPTIVLTGAHGFIGNNVLERLLKATPEELGLSAQTLSKFSNFDKSEKNEILSFIITDLSSSMGGFNARRFAGSARITYVDFEGLFAHLETLPQPPIAVVHNGACSSTTETNPQVFEKLNLGYSKAIWEYCSQKNVPLLYASSAATYGDGSHGFSDKKEDCAKYSSLNLYGKSKLDFDLWALEQNHTPPTWFGLRYFNVYGQFESHKGGQASMVYHGYNQATRTGKIKLFQSNTPEYTDGNQVRDFIYIDDVVEVTVKLLKLCLDRMQGHATVTLGQNGCFLNLGTGIPHTWNELATHVFEALGFTPNLEYIPIPDNIKNQYQNYTCADLSTFHALGIHHTFFSLKNGVTKYVQKHLVRGQ